MPLAPQTQNLISVCDHSSSLCAAVILQLGWHQHDFISSAEGLTKKIMEQRQECSAVIWVFYVYINIIYLLSLLGYKFERNVRTHCPQAGVWNSPLWDLLLHHRNWTLLKCQQHIVMINKMPESNQICNWKRQNSCFQPWNIHCAITAVNAAKSHL